MKTIAGICTPPGTSGIGIVRLSGADALDIAQKMFIPRGVPPHAPLLPKTATLGEVFGENFSDTCIAIYFKAPHSFTGEDTIEFQCHGGWFLLQQVVRTAIKNGAVAAERGEFSKRAFLNGKMTLDQAEAIIDIINAESELQLRAASTIYRGTLKQKVGEAEQTMVEACARLEAALDYPDEVNPQLDDVNALLDAAIKEIDALIATFDQGRIIANGVHVAVVGRPNVGKSSLFNALLDNERSIVTDIAGTTTDTITDGIIYNGIKFILSDTAGVREGRGKIEKLGVARTRAAIEDCDAVLAVFDVATAPHDEDAKILNLIKNKPAVVVLNKQDRGGDTGIWKKFLGRDFLTASAKTGGNIARIKQQLFDISVAGEKVCDGVIITNQRHLGALVRAREALCDAQAGLGGNITLDCVATDIRAALASIGEITGTVAGDAVLNEVFSRFCLGK